ncbi:MAG: PAS domain-containing protein [Alphaproteobacteria bacterium]|nr:PAS domain-containing protein [Alphaproteobacteria bacterium]
MLLLVWGMLGLAPMETDVTLPAGAALAAAFAFALAAAWAHGRRADIGPEARLVFSAAGENGAPLMITNGAGDILYANAGFGAGLRDGSAVTLPGALRFARADGPDAQQVVRALAAARGGATGHAEIAVHADGEDRWWKVAAMPVGGAHERLVSWTMRDVTAEREMETVRRGEDALMADLLENLPVGFLSMDARGGIIFANETACKWLGTGLGEIRSNALRLADFVVKSDVSAASGEGVTMTMRPRDGGDPFDAVLVQTGRRDETGALLYTRSVLVRNMERRPSGAQDGAAAGASARDLARRLYWLFDEAPVAIAVVDMQVDMVDCNGAFLKMLGAHKDDVLGRPFSERLVSEDKGEIGGQLSKVMMGILRAAHLEVRMPAAGGREVTASMYASRVEDADGEVTGLALHFIDTTEKKHLEVQFAQSQKMQSIGQLAGGIAHDFNNLLTAMIGFSDLLLARHGPDDPSFGDINQIRQNAVRATSLVRQLLAFSRKQTLEPKVINVREKLSDLNEVLKRLLGPTIELNIEHDRDLGLIRVDPVQFDQVVLNLAVNARDAMPGGGTLTIRAGNLSLDEPVERGLELVAAGDYVSIDVIDTGVGIRKEDIVRIFEPFYSTKDVGAGTGLGLSTVHGIVHQTGGYVFVDSAPGEGAVFTIYLPRHEDGADVPSKAASKPSREPLPQDAAPGLQVAGNEDLTGEGLVLLVEDEDAVRMFSARALREKGYTVLEATNGEEALEVINAQTKAIDLIVTDVVMPGMDGHTLVQFVRQEMPDVKVILISGFADNVLPGGVSPESGFAFLPKPFSLQDLASKVKAVMGA